MVAALSDWSPAAVLPLHFCLPDGALCSPAVFPGCLHRAPNSSEYAPLPAAFCATPASMQFFAVKMQKPKNACRRLFAVFMHRVTIDSPFRLDLARRAAADCVPSLRFFGALAAGSCLGALVGAFIAYFGLAAYFGGWGRESAYPILTGLIVLALLVAETWRIVLERLILRYRLHENSPR